MEKSTIFAISVLVLVSSGLAITVYHYSHDAEEIELTEVEQREIQQIQAMTCEEFAVRNSDGQDYVSSEVRDVAKEIRDNCN